MEACCREIIASEQASNECPAEGISRTGRIHRVAGMRLEAEPPITIGNQRAVRAEFQCHGAGAAIEQ